MRRLLLSANAVWHQWRAYRLARHAAWVAVNASAYARFMLDAAEAHAAEGAMNLMASRSLARGPLPAHDGDAEPAPAGCAFVGTVLLASIVGLFIAALWIWISARAGR